MTVREEFAVELDGAPVRAWIALPPAGFNRPVAAVLLCPGLPAPGPDLNALHARLVEALVAAGSAVAAVADGAAARLVPDAIDDAAALFHALALREDLDFDRLSVLGHAVGCLVAAGLARRTERLHRLCLLSPPLPTDVTGRAAQESERGIAARLGGTAAPPGFFEGVATLQPEADVAFYDRPTLIMHGAADRTVPPESSFSYFAALVAARRQAGHLLVALADHVYSNPDACSACTSHVTRFLNTTGAPPE